VGPLLVPASTVAVAAEEVEAVASVLVSFVSERA